jgi:hypothetical protein
LKDAGLVKDRSEGTRRVYYTDPDGLGELRRWLDGFWVDALDAFKNEVGQPKSPPQRKKPWDRGEPGSSRKTAIDTFVGPVLDEITTTSRARWRPLGHRARAAGEDWPRLEQSIDQKFEEQRRR